MISNKSITKWLSLSCVVASAFYFAHVFIGEGLYPGYNWLAQAVSDLTANGSPSAEVAGRYSSLYGLFACIGCIMTCLHTRLTVNKATRRGLYLFCAMHFVSNIGYTLFPLSAPGYLNQFQDIMHLYVVTTGVVLLSIASLVFIIIGGFQKHGIHSIAVAATACFVCMLAGSIGIGIVPHTYMGLMERFSVFSVVVFTSLVGIFSFLNNQKEA